MKAMDQIVLDSIPCFTSSLFKVTTPTHQKMYYKVSYLDGALEHFHKVPSPLENGWNIVDSVLEACRCVGEALPNQIFDLLGADGVSDDDDKETDPDNRFNDDSDDDF